MANHICYYCKKDLGGTYTADLGGNYCHTLCHPDNVEFEKRRAAHIQAGRDEAKRDIDVMSKKVTDLRTEVLELRLKIDLLTAERDEARASLAAAPHLVLGNAACFVIYKVNSLGAINGDNVRGVAAALQATAPADSAAALRTLRADAVREAANIEFARILAGVYFDREIKADAAFFKRFNEERGITNREEYVFENWPKHVDNEEAIQSVLTALADRIEKGEA